MDRAVALLQQLDCGCGSQHPLQTQSSRFEGPVEGDGHGVAVAAERAHARPAHTTTSTRRREEQRMRNAQNCIRPKDRTQASALIRTGAATRILCRWCGRISPSQGPPTAPRKQTVREERPSHKQQKRPEAKPEAKRGRKQKVQEAAMGLCTWLLWQMLHVKELLMRSTCARQAPEQQRDSSPQPTSGRGSSKANAARITVWADQ